MKLMNRIYFFRAFTLFILLITASIPAQSDWINLTGTEASASIAEIYVLDDHVKVKLEVYVGDLSSCEELIPDDWIEDPEIKRPALEERIEHFANTTLKFFTDDGKT